jgi:hypothetical protein
MSNHQPPFVSGAVNREGRFTAEGDVITAEKSPLDRDLAEVV